MTRVFDEAFYAYSLEYFQRLAPRAGPSAA